MASDSRKVGAQSTDRDPVPGPALPKAAKPTRRQVLQGLSLTAAVAGCSGAEDDVHGSGGTGPAGSGGTGAAGAGGGGASGTGGEPTGPVVTGGTSTGEGGTIATEVTPWRAAFDTVTLGNTAITTSRLAMGSGTTGTRGTSAQAQMGDRFTRVLVEGYERGIRFFETADAYGSHGVVAAALREVGRKNLTVLTKTMAKTRQGAQADLDRFMKELGTDYIDVVLLHIRTSSRWTTEDQGAMEALAEAKAKGRIRAHGVSCHSLSAMQLAAATDWVDVNLCRINPFSLHMDGDPATIIGVLEQMKARGQSVLGMKILGQGDAANRFDEAIEHATRLETLDGFTIGFRSTAELDQVTQKVASVKLRAASL